MLHLFFEHFESSLIHRIDLRKLPALINVAKLSLHVAKQHEICTFPGPDRRWPKKPTIRLSISVLESSGQWGLYGIMIKHYQSHPVQVCSSN